MLRAALIVSAAAAAAIAISATPGCGPACLDDRCSLSPTTPNTVRTDYVNRAPKDAGTTVAVVSSGSGSGSGSATGSGSAAVTPPPPTGSGSGSATVTPPPPTGTGSGSATPPAGTGSGSATPPPPPPPATSVAWQPLGDSFKMYVASKTVAAAGTVIRLEFVKTPEKTPFVITLESKPPTESKSGEAVWNDCPEGKIRCDASGTKTHTLKKAGQILLQAGVNWAVTGVTDDGKGTLVTWTNNLSRELVQVRLSK